MKNAKRRTPRVVGAGGVLFLLAACLGPSRPQVGSDRAVELFATHCASCHGADGSGLNDLPPNTLFPAARDFGSGLFSIVSTRNGVPTDADFEHVIRRGMPGSSMPSFHWMKDEDVRLLARHVRELGKHRAVVELTSMDHLSRRDAIIRSKERFLPGYPVRTPAVPKATARQLERGRALYLARCAACHGDYGTGRNPVANWAGGLSIHWARDFTAGILKGGASDRQLARRIEAGMPAAGMPPCRFEDEADLVALIAYVKKLIPPGADERLVQRRESVVVHKRKRLPASPDDPVWDEIEPQSLVLAPLAWRPAAVVRADVQAAHDGVAMCVRVRWKDRSNDTPGVGEDGYADRVALQFSTAERPGFFGMGSTRRPVHIWYWHPRAAKGEYGMLDLLDRGAPHRAFTDAAPVIELPQRAQEVRAVGHRSAREFGRQDRTVKMSARWADKRWTVMFERHLAARGHDELDLRTGQRAWFALAIWNGQEARSRHDKSFTIWQEFEVR